MIFLLNPKDLEIQFLKGSGPGGQNRNKRETAVRLTHLPTGISVVASERRSQAANMKAALERLEKKIKSHFHQKKPRKPTAISAAEKKKRLAGKKHRSKLKELRQGTFGDE